MLKAIKFILNFEWLAGVSIGIAKNVFLMLFVLIGVAVLLIPNDYVYKGIDKRRWWLNLKLWALVDLAFIFLTYYIF
ncbi:MAG: hypothetical protein JSW59_05805 [Phycisphaerales bacterium]|nr:MAG: hypothetical protein JSW59_05805 [Phycisphaerales bacterium]